ncbi:hypothetical protein ASQ66_gp19 [Aeropyrum pernix spindle-shaped virus 1]|uniref:Uncharacterized protein n=1 Tax=Aeropyrum pernix (strain ATCC 700893 / DSM 11879 / JCM 9820 / NBRC 100138 / K1) TaxID=272557 RepID=Q9YDS0_AERPE|nr:hypothetical protein [Aeropyrum pernix]YP_009177749.1 hypothetical protein ASQ66_gp19 [Aeropyrum pernix spindle-shaped virus 1]BAA79827.2 hypothetical protein APE_0847.1 [Aeropyrum pernix spindle-shaped virus 1] [Aeropyrum pernix K1]CCD22107.1 TPA: hypothetical protein [Aeropyrum pernix spindle-shaped virus 1]
MRALNMAVFIFLLSLSMSAVKEAFGLPHVGPVWSVGVEDVEAYGRVEYSGDWWGVSVFSAVKNGVELLGGVVGGALMLGSTLQAFIPFQLPGVLVMGLNILGSFAAALAFIQFVRGVSTRGME